MTKRVVDAIRAGASRVAAAEAANVARSTLQTWLRRGVEGDPEYTSFLAKVREAEGELEKELVGVIKGHSANTWQAAAWLLERKFQKRWAIRKESYRDVDEHEAKKLVAEAAELHKQLLAAGIK